MMESNKESNEEPNEKNNEKPNKEPNKELKKPVNRKPLIITAAIAAAVCIAAAAVFFFVNNDTEKRLTEQLDLAKRCLSELDYGSAITAYEAAIGINPKAEDAYIGLADAYIGLGDYEAAIEMLVRGIAESDSEMLTEYLAEVNAEYSQRERMRLAEEATIVKEAEANEYYETGRAYLYGLDGKEINPESAYNNFEKALEMGKTEANFYLGVLCDWYHYPEQDYEMARAYYEECGDDPYAQLALGFLYYYGQGVEEDKERAKELFQSVTSQGCVEGYLGTGGVLQDEEEYEAALEDYAKVLQGTEQFFIADAMNNIGWMYKNGYGVEQDYALAMEWYGKAADLGSANAMNNIGWAYCHGIGVKQDYALAIEWYGKAIDLGNAGAMNNIGYMYQYGVGVEMDYALAVEWYKKAADLGNTNAMNNTGCMYIYGDGVEQDYEMALEWFEKAADLGDESAIQWIEYMYENGYVAEREKNVVVTEGDHVMDWKDANLETAMRDITGITDRNIMLSDVQGYIGFDLSYGYISDISALSELTNLKTLSLNGNRISDISALSGLTNLEWLDLHDNNISDINALSGLTNLEWLALDGNHISDISALGGLTNLKTLCLEYNNISDISALSGLTNLQELYLYGNSITDYSPVSFVPTRDY